MAHTFRFLGEPVSASHWLIVDDGERHHCRKVLKLSAGATVEFTDGRGRGARGVLCPPPEAAVVAGGQGIPVNIPANAIWLQVAESWQTPPPAVGLHLLLGAIKPADWDQVLPPLAEIGIASVQIFACGASAKFRIDQKVKAKAEKILLNAIKQSKRDFLPQIAFWPSLDKALAAWLTDTSRGQRFMLCAENATAIDDIAPPAAGEVIVAVGDEAGFTTAATATLAAAGFRAVSFGSAIYRAKTAAICGAYFFRDRS